MYYGIVQVVNFGVKHFVIQALVKTNACLNLTLLVEKTPPILKQNTQ